jgi:hypothetical protein
LIGPTGRQGIQGFQGLRGSQGIQGVTGLQGTNGIQGITGPTGLQGPMGPTGTAGVGYQQGNSGATYSTILSELYFSGGRNYLFTNTYAVIEDLGTVVLSSPGVVWANATFEFLNTGTQSTVSAYIIIDGKQSNVTTTTIPGVYGPQYGRVKLPCQHRVYCGRSGNIAIQLGASCPYPGTVRLTYYDIFAIGNLT